MNLPALPVGRLVDPGRRAVNEVLSLATITRAGLLRRESPLRAVGAATSVARYGTLGGAGAAAAARDPDRVGLIDERGELTFAELDRRSGAVANGLIARGVKPGEGVAILARNHRGFLDATFGAAKCGARLVLLNTDFAGPQIREVCEREGARALICDEEYTPLLEGFEPALGRWRSWADSPGEDTLEHLIESAGGAAPPSPSSKASLVILTSGTTGTPKGAQRDEPHSLVPLAALFSKVPFRAHESTVIPAPLFHSLGFAHLLAAQALGSTVVLRRRFDPEALLDDISGHRASAAILVPVMLRRVLALGREAIDARELTSLRIIFLAGSQLGAELCLRATEAFGPVIYNLYGSTEVAYVTIATPEDLRVAPDCVGRPPRGVVVRLLDPDGKEVPAGDVGRIFVSNGFAFEGYTGGGGKEVIDGLMSTGDVGHLDAGGRLYIDGRDDDMIVSGAENVFPAEVEEELGRHPGIADAAVVGVPDEQWGQRLAAFVVPVAGVRLTPEEVQEHVGAHLARFKVPRDVHIVDDLPRNATGKILKRELTAP
ncbi:MAG TPA: acyl-CoA synthetase [Solirubrobacteraceae bacterium]|jgi:fatty-acyl-CoA synthase|nr:acyl-CoA synthetase [Solirubrobacteraceae bacterium]